MTRHSRWHQTPEVERFWSYVQKADGDACWLFIGARGTGRTAYQRFVTNDRRSVGANRYAYEITFGPLKPGEFACHRCDNPRCVRPDHLFAGTNADNIMDAYSKGRVRVPKRGRRQRLTICQRGHLFTPANTKVNTRTGGRCCRACQRERAAIWMKNRRAAQRGRREVGAS